jgi:hypothetical protein
MYIKPGTGYSINWPVRRGRLNLHDGPGGTVNAVMADIESIWGTALETFLDIPVKDLKVCIDFLSFLYLLSPNIGCTQVRICFLE